MNALATVYPFTRESTRAYTSVVCTDIWTRILCMDTRLRPACNKCIALLHRRVRSLMLWTAVLEGYLVSNIIPGEPLRYWQYEEWMTSHTTIIRSVGDSSLRNIINSFDAEGGFFSNCVPMYLLCRTYFFRITPVWSKHWIARQIHRFHFPSSSKILKVLSIWQRVKQGC